MALAVQKNIDIRCIQEHRWFYDAIDVHLRLDAGYCFLHKKYQYQQVGISIQMSPIAHKTLECIDKINSRIMVAKASGNSALAVIMCYSPTNCSPNDEAVTRLGRYQNKTTR